jgi:hypothetical protein
VKKYIENMYKEREPITVGSDDPRGRLEGVYCRKCEDLRLRGSRELELGLCDTCYGELEDLFLEALDAQHDSRYPSSP